MSIIETANQKYKYSQEYFGKTLDSWVQDVHLQVSKINNWTYRPLNKGAFGYDNFAVSIAYLFESLNSEEKKEDEMANIIHQGWIINYVYWRDNQPWTKGYFKPASPLNDERRNKCALTKFSDLPQKKKIKIFKLLKLFLIF